MRTSEHPRKNGQTSNDSGLRPWFTKEETCCLIDWCCFYYFLRNSLVALLEALFARIFLDLRYRCGILHGGYWQHSFDWVYLSSIYFSMNPNTQTIMSVVFLAVSCWLCFYDPLPLNELEAQVKYEGLRAAMMRATHNALNYAFWQPVDCSEQLNTRSWTK